MDVKEEMRIRSKIKRGIRQGTISEKADQVPIADSRTPPVDNDVKTHRLPNWLRSLLDDLGRP